MATENDQLAAPTVSNPSVQPTDTYDSRHGKYEDQVLSTKPSSFGSQVSHVKSTFSMRGK